MELSSPICLRPEELVKLAGLLIHSLIPTAVLQCLCLFLYVQKFLVNSYRKKKLNQHQIVAGSFKKWLFTPQRVSEQLATGIPQGDDACTHFLFD